MGKLLKQGLNLGDLSIIVVHAGDDVADALASVLNTARRDKDWRRRRRVLGGSPLRRELSLPLRQLRNSGFVANNFVCNGQ